MMGMNTRKGVESVASMKKPGLCRHWYPAWRQAKRHQAIARPGAVLRNSGSRKWGRSFEVWF